MAILRSEGGAALITALMLTLLTLVIALTLLTIITTGTKVSGSQKRYRSSLAAAQGGAELLAAEIVPRLFQAANLDKLEQDYALINLQLTDPACLKQKLEQPVAGWSKCNSAQTSVDPAQAPDVSFRLAGEPPAKGFLVTSKLVDTIPGNSDASGNDLLDPGGAVSSGDDTVRPRHVPAMYNLSVQGVREEAGSREKARLSVLYAY
ncbi:hypothetical protein [Citrifermentans bremense]|uniref:hypothetical protein n=1 Tax=Citrifermentans bremense TaxID=60035 RepID=UPI000412ABC5|nr:hypothetical protein [Citrifermentans bremense]